MTCDNYFSMYIYRFITQHVRLEKATTSISEGVVEMSCVMASIMLNLCHGGLQQVDEVECLEAILIEDEITYREKATCSWGCWFIHERPRLVYELRRSWC